MVCALAAAAVLWMQAGPQFLKLRGGATPLGPEDDLSKAQGEYISCDVAYPVASYVAEYYSGDPDRVKDYGYVVYDAERHAFFCIVEGEQSDGDYASLLYNLELAAELRATKDMDPAPVEGSLEPMEQADIDKAIEALQESEILNMYIDYQDSKGYYDAYFGDEYGKVMADMCQRLSRGMEQSEWYCIVSGSINGVEIPHIWVCIFTAVLSILIAIGSLISLFTGGGGKKSAAPGEGASAMDRFLYEQRGWVEEWCQYCLDKARRSAYLAVLIWVVVLGAIGFFAKTPVQKLMVFHLPLGLLLGELTGLFIVWLQKKMSKPRKILKRMGKQIRKALPSPGAQEEFAEDFLKAGKEWEFQERKKDNMLYGRLGARYWSAFMGTGVPVLVEVDKLERVEPETVSGSVRSGKVRVSYESHVAKFYYKGTPLWENGDRTFTFQNRSNRDAFIALAIKRGVDGVQIREG